MTAAARKAALDEAVQQAMTAFMHASEAAGGEYRDAAIDATTVLGVQIAQAIAPIENGFARQRMVELFCEHLPHAVEAARLEALSSLAGTGTRQ